MFYDKEHDALLEIRRRLKELADDIAGQRNLLGGTTRDQKQKDCLNAAIRILDQVEVRISEAIGRASE